MVLRNILVSLTFGVLLLITIPVANATCPIHHTCGQKPDNAPRLHAGIDDQAEIKAFNRQVMNHNANVRRWSSCVQDYVQACRMEADKAQAAANEFINRLNNAVRENNK